MKKIISVLLSITLAVLAAASLSACKKQETPTVPASNSSAAESSVEPTGETVQIVNPIIDYDTYAEAAKAAGFDLDTPDLAEAHFSVIDGKIFQIDFGAGLIRKAKGSSDISGDYNDYDNVREVKSPSSEITVTLKGNGDKISLMTWKADGFSFSVSFNTPQDEESAQIFMEWVK